MTVEGIKTIYWY